ncbi:MAG: hypothetical protein V2J10_13055, partial [Wenzhouxiangella sp.]|nr:hypothetical protein [Wenzhouxiangella sp.]
FVWESAGQDESGFGIYARRFSGPQAAELTIVAGADQAAAVNEPFAQPLVVEVRDQWGQLSVDEPIHVSSPDDSAGVVFANGLSEIEIPTDAQGRVSIPLRANARPGAFELLVESSLSGVQQRVTLENLVVSGASSPIPVPALAPWALALLMVLVMVLGRSRLC